MGLNNDIFTVSHSVTRRFINPINYSYFLIIIRNVNQVMCALSYHKSAEKSHGFLWFPSLPVWKWKPHLAVVFGPSNAPSHMLRRLPQPHPREATDNHIHRHRRQRLKGRHLCSQTPLPCFLWIFWRWWYLNDMFVVS